MFHIVMSTGDVVPCRSLSCSIPAHYDDVSTARAHYEKIADAEYRPMASHTRRATPNRRREVTSLAAVSRKGREDLNSAFASFARSAVASAPPVDRGDWRAKQAADADRNGDSYWDVTPDTSVSGYHDASVQEGDEDFVRTEDLPEEFQPF